MSRYPRNVRPGNISLDLIQIQITVPKATPVEHMKKLVRKMDNYYKANLGDTRGRGTVDRKVTFALTPETLPFIEELLAARPNERVKRSYTNGLGKTESYFVGTNWATVPVRVHSDAFVAEIVAADLWELALKFQELVGKVIAQGTHRLRPGRLVEARELKADAMIELDNLESELEDLQERIAHQKHVIVKYDAEIVKYADDKVTP